MADYLNSQRNALDGAIDGTRAAWRRAMTHALSREERVLLILWYSDGWGAQEIASILETTVDRVTVMHDEIVDRLRGLMPAA